LLLYDKVLVENKAGDETADPFAAGENFPNLARRYSIALLQRVSFVVFAYKPKTEAVIPTLTRTIQVSQIESVPEEHAQVRIVIPWGTGVPSGAKAAPAFKK